MVLLIVVLWLVLKIPAVQNWVGHIVTNKLAQRLNTKVTVKHVSFSLFNTLNLEGLYIQDQQNDTLLYAGTAGVHITDWFFTKNSIDLSAIQLYNAIIKAQRTTEVWNYQFVLNALGLNSTKDTTASTTNSQAIRLKDVDLKNITIQYNDLWLGQSQTIQAAQLKLIANEINFNKHIVDIKQLTLLQPNYSSTTSTPLQPYIPSNVIPVSQPQATPDKYYALGNWKLYAASIILQNGTIQLAQQAAPNTPNYFDPKYITVSSINTIITNLNWATDTVKLNLYLSAKERCGIQLDTLRAVVKVYPNTVQLSQLLLLTPNSTLRNNVSFSYNAFSSDVQDFLHKIYINANLEPGSTIHTNDIAYFAPALSTVNKKLQISGNITGTINDLTANDLVTNVDASKLSGNLTIKGLPNIQDAYITLSNGILYTTANELGLLVPKLKTNDAIQQLKYINYQGNFKGYITNFTLQGNINTALGSAATSLSLQQPAYKPMVYNATIATTGFALGTLLGNKQLGNIAFNGSIIGQGTSLPTLRTTVNGALSSITLNGYKYTNLTTNTTIANSIITAAVTAADPNVQAKLNATINLATTKPAFTLQGNVQQANLKALGLTTQAYNINGYIDGAWQGTTIDAFDGYIHIKDGLVQNNTNRLPLQNVTLQSSSTKDGKQWSITTTELQATVQGVFNYKNLPNTIENYLHLYYPSIFTTPRKVESNQNFNFAISTKNIDAYTALLNNGITGFNQAYITGNINTTTNQLQFNASIPSVSIFNKYKATNIDLQGTGTYNSLVLNGTIDKLNVNDSIQFISTAVNLSTLNNATTFSIASTGNRTLNALNLNGTIAVFNDGIQANFTPSSFTINNQKWELENNGELIVRKSVYVANNFKLVHNDQEIALQFEAPSEDDAYRLVANVKNVEINDFLPLFITTNKLQGKLFGKIIVSDPLKNPVVYTENLNIKNFVKDDEPIGDIDIEGKYTIATNKAEYKVISNNPNYSFTVNGSYNPQDSTGTTISNTIVLNRTNVKIVENYLSGIFKNISGLANGELTIFGTTKQQYILGKVDIADSLMMTVKYTNVPYIVKQGSITFNANDIDFSNLKLYDTLRNTGLLSRGRIRHNGFFKDMALDIELSTDKMLLINTNRNINNTFYGNAIADAKLKITGHTDALTMNIVVNNPASANITLNTSVQGRTLGKADFIEFKTYGREMKKAKVVTESNMAINMLLNANTNANIRVILDELTGDNIAAKGNGNIRLSLSPTGNVAINGIYTVEDGSYDFNLNSFIRKPFRIQKGSSIVWNGDPLNAIIDINALYPVKNVVLNDLMNNTTTGGKSINADLMVVAKLSQSLAKPLIKFDILNNSTTQSNNIDVDNLLDVIKHREGELNRQVAFLVLFDRLFPLNLGQAADAIRNTGINTISNIIAKEATSAINKLLENVFASKNVRFNLDLNTYTPGGLQANVGNRLSSNIGLQFNFLDNRLVLYANGNVDFGLTGGNSSAIPILPNLILEYKIRKDGSIVGTIFTKTGIDLFATNTAQSRRTSTGGGLVWRKDGETFGELFGKKKKKKS